MSGKFKKGDEVAYVAATIPEPRRYTAQVLKCGPKKATVLTRFEIDKFGKKIGDYLGYSHTISPDTLTARRTCSPAYSPGWYIVIDDEENWADDERPCWYGPYDKRGEAEAANRKFYNGDGAVMYDGGPAETRALMRDC